MNRWSRGRLARATGVLVLVMCSFALAPNGFLPRAAAAAMTISGTVTSEYSHAGISGVTVGAYASVVATTPAVTTTTSANGTYSLPIATAGTYFIKFSKNPWDSQWWYYQPTQARAAAINWVDGGSRTGIDGELTITPSAGMRFLPSKVTLTARVGYLGASSVYIDDLPTDPRCTNPSHQCLLFADGTQASTMPNGRAIRKITVKKFSILCCAGNVTGARISSNGGAGYDLSLTAHSGTIGGVDTAGNPMTTVVYGYLTAVSLPVDPLCLVNVAGLADTFRGLIGGISATAYCMAFDAYAVDTMDVLPDGTTAVSANNNPVQLGGGAITVISK